MILMNVQLLELSIGISTSYILRIPTVACFSKLFQYSFYYTFFSWCSRVPSVIEIVLLQYYFYVLCLVNFYSFSIFFSVSFLFFPHLMLSFLLNLLLHILKCSLRTETKFKLSHQLLVRLNSKRVLGRTQMQL